MLEELWRLLAILDVLAFWMMAYWIVHQHAGETLRNSKPLRALIHCSAALLSFVMLAVVFNFMSPVPPTDGVKFFAAAMVLVVLYLGRAIYKSEREAV